MPDSAPDTWVLDGSEGSGSAAVELALRHPASGLLPADAAGRARSLRGLVYIAANCDAAIGVIDDPERWLAGGDGSAAIALRHGARARLHRLWELFADPFHDTGQPWLSGAEPGAPDLLATVVSCGSGTRAHLAAQRPALLALLQRVEALPEHAEVLARHFPPRA
jgi:GST-like protein